MLQDKKYTCPQCGFESALPGYCPVDDANYMKKVCECQSGSYASECCEPELEKEEKEMENKMTAELNDELEKEVEASERMEISLEEAAELENQEDGDDDNY
ncbi:hypothetical protein IT409_02700 [Candidatus Falkowbacteria bacterium]|nr:hypothetical protein [Candidatus Falkowbacteria bacterium]